MLFEVEKGSIGVLWHACCRGIAVRLESREWLNEPGATGVLVGMEETQQLKCAKCRKPLRLGVDVITLEHGVIGPRGVVPLQDIQLFCSDACREESVDSSDSERLPRKIP